MPAPRQPAKPAPPNREGQDLTTGIIHLLQEDGRMPYSTIAAQLGVSEGTVRNRVRQLIDDHVITIQAEAMPAAFGYEFNTVTFIKVNPSSNVDLVAARFAPIPEVYYIVQMIGRYDLGLAAFHRSMEDYRQFLDQHCYNNKAIAEIETTLNLKIHKFNTRWRFGPER
jgi:Lrp/AsnC family transcriptional regulator for asnA, asnC and gidA